MAEASLHPRLRRLPATTVCGRSFPVAAGLRARLLGLAFLERGEAGAGLLLPHCSCVHGLGMRFPLLVVFLDEFGRPLAARALAPRRLVAHPGAAAALELPAREPEP